MAERPSPGQRSQPLEHQRRAGDDDQHISGSPVAMYAFDLNSSIFTEDGEFFFYGPIT
jgi:hypothetical protein